MSEQGRLLSLSAVCVSGKASKEMTEEMMLRKTEKNRKRRQAAQRRKEKRKVPPTALSVLLTLSHSLEGRDGAQAVGEAA